MAISTLIVKLLGWDFKPVLSPILNHSPAGDHECFYYFQSGTRLTIGSPRWNSQAGTAPLVLASIAVTSTGLSMTNQCTVYMMHCFYTHHSD